MKPKIWLSPPHMCGEEQKFISQAFSTNWIAPLGPNVDGFESDIESYLQNDCHVAALSSGTAAIHLALILLGIESNDEVICQSFTFSGSANPILYLGATPIFIDSEKNSWNLCPKQLEIAITDRISKGKKPKAIIAVHLYGMPYQTEAINRIGRNYDIPIIEDSAEALGSSRHNVKCGSLGDLSILSFNGNKIITTSGGGALIAKNIDTKKRAIFLATQARDEDIAYLHSNIGFNYRMSNILAGIGRGQMTALESYVTKRRFIFDYYEQNLSHIKELEFLHEADGNYSNRWLSCFLTPNYENREMLRIRLSKENIESRPLWRPLHQQPIFKNSPSYLNGISDDLFDRGLCLPSGSNITTKDLDKIISIIKACF
ncbi:MAG: DegT/DnrJ/EryC1/StrS family aminotransferase [Flavobacteriaceae bacterium]|jgi:dTDP-4-amino-4,6-dideoxygalactose transaminase|nr:pyridoxal phosphate-dependent aminotransferase [Bacteroidota bacterium]MDG1378796.1 DegT/DnrJ/EryC1/StrS family aminotransferase [Flavobacteriaceae bacterium]MDG2350099.1 DegT/DnrJ/EryC1/StrS family aminotransferase [Flavobacteriaceae bacterium]|tara:strand:+ start:4222 stop:5340 length:1119 start_codon:yes stop_codon:yes gene_type:complete